MRQAYMTYNVDRKCDGYIQRQAINKLIQYCKFSHSLMIWKIYGMKFNIWEDKDEDIAIKYNIKKKNI